MLKQAGFIDDSCSTRTDSDDVVQVLAHTQKLSR
jgi:hypothetical protein